MKATIEKGIPMPTASVGAKVKWPIRDLGVGDSFAAPLTKYDSIRSLVVHHNKTGKRFAARTIKESNQVRVWRIA